MVADGSSARAENWQSRPPPETRTVGTCLRKREDDEGAGYNPIRGLHMKESHPLSSQNVF